MLKYKLSNNNILINLKLFMKDSFDFIGIRNLKIDLFLQTLGYNIKKASQTPENLYISIIPFNDNLSLVEFADFIPVTRYSDFDLSGYILPLARCFNTMFLFSKNLNAQKGEYRKYLNGRMQTHYKGEKAYEKGLLFDLIIDVDEFNKVLTDIWDLKASDKHKPKMFQLINDSIILDEPLEINYASFYG